MAYVVVGKRATENRLVIGWDREDTEGLYSRECIVGTVSSINEKIASLKRAEAQPRYRAKAEPVKLEAFDGGRVRLIFEKGQRALVPGQIMAFYDGGRLLGGGVVENVG
jgi:tRNA-specific 2-thiouridylase